MPGKKLVIVESPTKMKSIAAYLGDGYEVLSSVGHIRDLIEPKYLPAELKKGSIGVVLQSGALASAVVGRFPGVSPFGMGCTIGVCGVLAYVGRLVVVRWHGHPVPGQAQAASP